METLKNNKNDGPRRASTNLAKSNQKEKQDYRMMDHQSIVSELKHAREQIQRMREERNGLLNVIKEERSREGRHESIDQFINRLSEYLYEETSSESFNDYEF